MKINYINKIIFKVLIILLFTGCTEDWLDVNNNPNDPTKASLNLLLPSAQTNMGFYMSRVMNENPSIFARQYYSLSESQYTHDGSTYAADFDRLFSQALKDYQEIIDQGSSQKRWYYVGIAKVCKAYTYMVMVDLWGDLPFDEGLNGEENLYPNYNDDAEVYSKVLSLLDQAIVDLKKEDLDVEGDLIYDGKIANWITVAKSIKLRMYINTRLVDSNASTTAINAILDDEDFINDNSLDFEFQFVNSIAPLNRHPLYQQEYAGSGNKTFYMDNYFMYNLIKKNDPRLPYYIYRQDDGSSITFETLPCNTRTDCIYGYLGDHPDFAGGEGDGYLGRDHGDPSGLPGDDEIRATFGVYPIGGTYDDGAFKERTNKVGTGAGILPFLSNSMLKFLTAEAALTLGTEGDPRELLKEGIVASMEKVSDFSTGVDPNAPAIDTADVNDYVDARLADYDAAANDTQRLNVIIKEKYYASFGNGMEVFTDVRRTGMPLDLPTSLVPAAPFPLRLHYSVNEINTNPNAPSPPSINTPIFWDK